MHPPHNIPFSHWYTTPHPEHWGCFCEMHKMADNRKRKKLHQWHRDQSATMPGFSLHTFHIVEDWEKGISVSSLDTGSWPWVSVENWVRLYTRVSQEHVVCQDTRTILPAPKSGAYDIKTLAAIVYPEKKTRTITNCSRWGKKESLGEGTRLRTMVD